MLSNSTIKPLLTPELMAVIAAKVALGRYRSGSEVARAALHLLVEQDRWHELGGKSERADAGERDAQ